MRIIEVSFSCMSQRKPYCIDKASVTAEVEKGDDPKLVMRKVRSFACKSLNVRPERINFLCQKEEGKE